MRALCKLLLEKMGERIYDISKIPNNDWPEKNWVGANPAQELQAIAEQYGCRVVYNPQTDGVYLYKLGEGAQLPDAAPGLISSDQIEIDPPEPPGKIVVLGAEIKYQVRFLLEAVGLDFDGRVKLLDELSYTPKLGWDRFYSIPWRFIQAQDFRDPLPGDYTWFDANQLMVQSVFRWYRIKTTLPTPASNNFTIPVDSTSYADRHERKRIDLLENRVETTVDSLGQRLMMGATCYGRAILASADYKETSPGQEIRIPFSIDQERQLIKFNSYVYRRNVIRVGTRVVSWGSAANIILETSCNVREPDTNSTRRYRYELVLTKPPKGKRPRSDELVIIREDIKNYIKVNYIDAINNEVNTTVSNTPACEKQAKYYAEGELKKFQLKTPQTRSYNGIMPVMCDGAIQSVMLEAGVNGCRTRASRNNEGAYVIQPYNVRRRQEQATINTLVGPGYYSLKKSQYGEIAAARDFLQGSRG